MGVAHTDSGGENQGLRLLLLITQQAHSGRLAKVPRP